MNDKYSSILIKFFIRSVLVVGFFCVNIIRVEAVQNLSEKKASLEGDANIGSDQLKASECNLELKEKRCYLETLYSQAWVVYNDKGADSVELLNQIRANILQLKQEIAFLEKDYLINSKNKHSSEEYALWNEPETTVMRLIADFGTSEYVYLVDPAVRDKRICISSAVPIPRESWKDCLELVLNRSGIGIRTVSPFIKEVFSLNENGKDNSIVGFFSKEHEIDIIPDREQICFIIAPDKKDLYTTTKFLKQFSKNGNVHLEQIIGKLFVTGPVEDIRELLKVYDFLRLEDNKQECRLIGLSKFNSEEMANLLNVILGQSDSDKIYDYLKIIPLQYAQGVLCLIGSKEVINEAVKIVEGLETQIRKPKEKEIIWYTVKHSDPQELAEVLARVYDLLIDNKGSDLKGSALADVTRKVEKLDTKIVPSTKIGPSQVSKPSKVSCRDEFVVDPKSGSIIMVVEQSLVSQVKELVKKLDVPKKMVRLEILLFEKKASNRSQIGLNMFKMGPSISPEKWGVDFSGATGFLGFIFGKKDPNANIPPYEAAYSFLMNREDVKINSSPSIVTMNQTPAKIAIVEEISIDIGGKDIKTYDRAQYGITIQITPIINIEQDFDSQSDVINNWITLDTDITFDTMNKAMDKGRPDVTRRHIKNNVRIADGQTVILGGLKRKNQQTGRESIPFFGDLPGIGKLFSMNSKDENSTEMFVCITPTIIEDRQDEVTKEIFEEYKQRPGDIIEYKMELEKSKNHKRAKMLEKSMKTLLDSNAEE